MSHILVVNLMLRTPGPFDVDGSAVRLGPARHDESDAACVPQAHVALDRVDSTSGSSRSNPTGQNPPSTRAANTPCLSHTIRFGKDVVAADRIATDQPTTTNTTLTYDLSGVQPAGRSKRKVPAATRRQIAADRMAGASIRDLTERYNLARSSVQNILSKEGVPPRRDLIGEQHRAELERLRRQGLSAAQIATRFGVSASTVLRAIRRMEVK